MHRSRPSTSARRSINKNYLQSPDFKIKKLYRPDPRLSDYFQLLTHTTVTWHTVSNDLAGKKKLMYFKNVGSRGNNLRENKIVDSTNRKTM